MTGQSQRSRTLARSATRQIEDYEAGRLVRRSGPPLPSRRVIDARSRT